MPLDLRNDSQPHTTTTPGCHHALIQISGKSGCKAGGAEQGRAPVWRQCRRWTAGQWQVNRQASAVATAALSTTWPPRKEPRLPPGIIIYNHQAIHSCSPTWPPSGRTAPEHHPTLRTGRAGQPRKLMARLAAEATRYTHHVGLLLGAELSSTVRPAAASQTHIRMAPRPRPSSTLV